MTVRVKSATLPTNGLEPTVKTLHLAPMAIRNANELRDWLTNATGPSGEWAAVIAARASLRALPFVVPKLRAKWVNALAFGAVRANAISWAARNYPAHDMVAAAYAAAYAAFWAAVDADCLWLKSYPRHTGAAQALTGQKLWLTDAPQDWDKHWATACTRLLSFDDRQSYQVWVDWFDRRISGQESAFAIPGDTGRIEDKAILARLAEAQNEDFWDKGSTHVNLTLQSWIDEARARTGPGTTPSQDMGATTYGLNTSGKLDRFPASDQRGLQSLPDQRQMYQDVRKAALALQAEGQRLGATLKAAVDQFLVSFPEEFDAARCYSVWRDAVGLRTILLEHKAVAEGTEPDEKRLDPAVAERLGGFLNQYNVFAIGDGGLRAKDEAAISPQERATADEEAEKAAPLVDAMLDYWPEIMTDAVHDDLLAEESLEVHYPLDPYGGQLIDQANRTKRNIFAGLIAGVGKLVSKAKEQIGKTAGNMRDGADKAVGALIISEMAGVTKVHVPILKFLKENLSAMKAYAETAYANTSLQ